MCFGVREKFQKHREGTQTSLLNDTDINTCTTFNTMPGFIWAGLFEVLKQTFSPRPVVYVNLQARCWKAQSRLVVSVRWELRVSVREEEKAFVAPVHPDTTPSPPNTHTHTPHMCTHTNTINFLSLPHTQITHNILIIPYSQKSVISRKRGWRGKKEQKKKGPSERETLVLNSSVLLPGLEAFPTKCLSVVGVGFREGQWLGDVGHLHGFHLILSTAG